MARTVYNESGYNTMHDVRHRVGGRFFTSNNEDITRLNRSITNIVIIKAVMSSATEAELDTLLLNSMEVVTLKIY